MVGEIFQGGIPAGRPASRRCALTRLPSVWGCPSPLLFSLSQRTYWVNLLRGFLLFCILLLVAGTTVSARAAVSILPLDDNSHYAKLGGYLQFADATADGIEPAAAPTDPAAWATLRGATLNLGYRQQPVWLQLDFQTASLTNTNWLLEVANS